MSSKSKKNQPRKGRARSGHPTKKDLERELEKQALAAGGGGSSASDAMDEFVHAPKESSKLRFVLLIGLLVFLLIVFIIPGALFGTARGVRDDEEGFRWDHPTEGTVQFTRTDFVLAKRSFDTALSIDPFMRITLGMDVQGTPSDKEIARLLVIDGLAEDAGIVISDGDLAEYLTGLVQQRFGGSNDLFFQAAQRSGGVKNVEDTLRRLLRARRYVDLVGHVASIPDAGKIEELWNEEHVEYAFDFVEVPVEGAREEVAAALPDEAELAAWFEALSDEDRSRFEAPEKRVTQFASYQVGSAADELVAAFPDADEATPEDRAREYYDRVFFQRFRRPAEDPPEAPEEGAEGEESEPAEPPSEYLSFEEVQEEAMAEAPVYHAMGAWLEDMELRRSAGEEVDLAAEAERYGLSSETTEPLTRDELIQREGLGGPNLAIMAFQSAEGAFSPNVQILPEGFCIQRVLEITAPAIPPLAEIQDQVLEEWTAERIRTRTIERLTAVRDSFAEYVPQEDEEQEEDPAAPDEDEPKRRTADKASFEQAVGDAGYEVQVRDWQDKSGLPPTGALSEQDRFFRGHTEFFGLEPGEVTVAMLDSSGTNAYLVRLADTREVPIERMKASEYDAYKRRTSATAKQTFQEQLSYEFLSERHAAWVWSEDLEDEEEDLEDLE